MNLCCHVLLNPLAMGLTNSDNPKAPGPSEYRPGFFTAFTNSLVNLAGRLITAPFFPVTGAVVNRPCTTLQHDWRGCNPYLGMAYLLPEIGATLAS